MSNDIIPPGQICDYGCEKPATHYFKYSKKYCCGYNVQKCQHIKKINGAKSVGRKTFLNKHHTKEAKKKISDWKTGRPNPPGSNEKNRQSNTGKKMPPRTNQWRENQRKYMLNGGSKKAASFINDKSIEKRILKVRKKMEEKNRWTKIDELPNLYLYTNLVWHFTNISSRQKFTKEELKTRGQKKEKNHKHLDHIFSIHEGFKLGILPQIIGSKSNIRLIDCTSNYSKQSKCDITLEELFKIYDTENPN